MEVAVAGVLQVIVRHRVVLLISYPVNDSNIPPSRLRTALCRNHQVLSFTMYHSPLTRKTTIRRYHNDHIHIFYDYFIFHQISSIVFYLLRQFKFPQ